MIDDRSPGLAAARPWARVSADSDFSGEITRAASEWLAARVGRTRAVPPPSGARGCLLCGVATVSRAPGQHDGVAWADPIEWSLSNLGAKGRRGYEKVRGHLCPPCRDQYEQHGYVTGPTLIEDAYIAYHQVPLHNPWGFDIPHLRGWAASGTSAPSAKPWGHVPPAVLKAVSDVA